MSQPEFPTLDGLFSDAVAQGVFPGAAYAFGTSHRTVFGTAGRLSYHKDSPEVDLETVYDLASLTKVIVTNTSAMCLYQDGALILDQPVAEVIPEFIGSGKQAVTIKNLLLHNSGLPAHRDFWKILGNAEDRWRAILAEPIEAVPGVRTHYSCVGFLVLQQVLLRLTGERYEEAWTWPFHRIARGLGANLVFCPDSNLRSRIAPTEEIDGVVLQGVVHDENSRSLGGIAGNAGLFGDVRSVARFARWILNNGEGLVEANIVREWTRRQAVADPLSTRGLGWDTKSVAGSSAGDQFGPHSFGHTGFTGTSLWIDPDLKRFAVLLTNRVHPTRENVGIQAFRPLFHNLISTLMNGLE